MENSLTKRLAEVWEKPILLVGTGIFLTIRTRFLTWRNLGYALKSTLSKEARTKSHGEGDVSPFSALTTALAATIGTGNIVGVATAMVSGGPGALVWMWISAAFGLTSKFSECMLAIKSTEVTRIDKKEFKFPINYELNILEGISEENLDIMVDVEKYEISSQTDNIQINIDLNISTKMFKTIELNIIEDLEEKELEDKEEYSIIVYFVKAGDTLWNIAKKFRSTVENIKQINNIEDEDKLAINQQLFIPRYVEKVKAM